MRLGSFLDSVSLSEPRVVDLSVQLGYPHHSEF